VKSHHATHQPSPSIWPVTLAVGVGLVAVGLITNWFVLLSGALITALALYGWVAESLGESS
jgi:cytochrome c oxidase subunit IV